jgi:excisionase family DNA binding protein
MSERGLGTLGPWLELGEAADYIGVHYTTLRRWADDGKVPCIRTPGGRRRFKKGELDLFMASLRQGESPASTALQKMERRMTADQSDRWGVREEPWYNRLDESQRQAMRTEGQQLMAVLMQYATRSNGGDAFLEEGKRLATHYGEVCHASGLSLVETMRAFILVRRSITDSVYEAGALVGPPDAETWRLYDRTNHFLDTLLLTIVGAYDRARQQASLTGGQSGPPFE